MQASHIKQRLIGLTTLGFLLSASAYAAPATHANALRTHIPHLRSGYNFTLEGLYLKPSTSNLAYATVGANAKSLDPKASWGFGLGAGYTFVNSGNDVQFFWEHLSPKTVADAVSTGGAGTVNPLIGNNNFYTDGVNYDYGQGSARFKFDTVDADVGQYLDVTKTLQARLFAGLRFAQIERDLSGYYTPGQIPIMPPTVVSTVTASDVAKYTGIGPILGINAHYKLNASFAIATTLDAAILMGSSKFNSNALNVTTAYNGLTPPITVSTPYSSSYVQHPVVPSLDAKLALDYTHTLPNRSALTFELGYRVSHYDDLFIDAERQTSSFNLAGPYISLNDKL